VTSVALKYRREDIVEADRTLKETGEVAACGGGCCYSSHYWGGECICRVLLRQYSALLVGVGDRTVAPRTLAGVGGHGGRCGVAGPQRKEAYPIILFSLSRVINHLFVNN